MPSASRCRGEIPNRLKAGWTATAGTESPICSSARSRACPRASSPRCSRPLSAPRSASRGSRRAPSNRSCGRRSIRSSRRSCGAPASASISGTPSARSTSRRSPAATPWSNRCPRRVNPAQPHLPEWKTGQVGIDQQYLIVQAQLDAGRSQPAEIDRIAHVQPTSSGTRIKSGQ